MLQDLRVSVGQTWRFVTNDDTSTVSQDVNGYRGQIDALKNGADGNGFLLPWPRYRSRFWEYTFGRDYENTGSFALVNGLLPLLSEDLIQPGWLRPRSGKPFAHLESAEAYFHDFAVTTVVHLFLPGPGLPEAQQASMLDELFRLPLAAGQPGQVRDGAPISLLPALPSRDADRKAARYELSGSFVSLSGVHRAADPMELAYRLASLYTDTASDKSQPMNSGQSAISVTAGRVGMLLPERARPRLECLHRNITMLLACMENFAAVLQSQDRTTAYRWFQQQAALLLNCLYRREPPPGARGIYKSRAAELWIAHRGLAAAINTVNAQAPATPPPGLP